VAMIPAVNVVSGCVYVPDAVGRSSCGMVRLQSR